MRHPSRAAFSLVELMVVVVIIGLLGTIAVIALIPVVDDSEIKTSCASMQVVRAAIRGDRISTGQYPQTLDDLVTDPGVRGWRRGGYLEIPPEARDAWGNAFHYEPPRRGTDAFILLSLGADHAEGGEGKDADFGPDAYAAQVSR